MLRPTLALVLLSLVATEPRPGEVLASRPRVPSTPPSAAARIDALLKTARDRGIFNGSALVARADAVVYRGDFGYADGGRTRRLDAQDRYSIGSIAKEFSAVAILLLEGKGALRLDDAVSRFVPGLPSWAARVQVRHLLDYTSGLPPVRVDGVASEDDLLNDLRSLKALTFEPGTGYLYSNNNILLRRKVIEGVTHAGYAEFAQAEIFKPCGMAGVVNDPVPSSSRLAHAFNNDLVDDVATDPMRGWTRVTIDDLYRWTQCLDFGRLLPRSSLVRLARTDDEDRQGPLGDLVVAGGALQRHVHSGSDFNFEARLHVDVPEATTVLLLTNNKNFKLAEITTAILAILHGQPYEAPRRSVYLALRARIEQQGYDSGMAFLEKISVSERETYDFTDPESDLGRTAFYLLRKGRTGDALRLFRHNVAAHPSSASAWQRLAEALTPTSRDEAIAGYRRALQLDPSRKTAREALDALVALPQR